MRSEQPTVNASFFLGMHDYITDCFQLWANAVTAAKQVTEFEDLWFAPHAC